MYNDNMNAHHGIVKPHSCDEERNLASYEPLLPPLSLFDIYVQLLMASTSSHKHRFSRDA